MRNFYLEADIDGRETMLAGGPRAKDGGMTVWIRRRNEGRSEVAFTVYCWELDGELTMTVRDRNGHTVAETVCHR